MTRRLAVALLLALAAPAAADTLVALPRTKALLELPAGWQAVAAPTLVAAYKHERGPVLAVTRADVPNPDAWRSQTKAAYADEVERGIAATLPGYKRISKKLVSANGIPALDVEARREGGATVVIRVLLFRTYALSLAIEVPARSDVAAARTIASRFAPPNDPALAN